MSGTVNCGGGDGGNPKDTGGGGGGGNLKDTDGGDGGGGIPIKKDSDVSLSIDVKYLTRRIRLARNSSTLICTSYIITIHIII